jgi:hypothetical protein
MTSLPLLWLRTLERLDPSSGAEHLSTPAKTG